jgi:hypothetical protein
MVEITVQIRCESINKADYHKKDQLKSKRGTMAERRKCIEEFSLMK